jgi:hypothetical protein
MIASFLGRILIHGHDIYYRVDISVRMIKKGDSVNLEGSLRQKIDDTLLKVTEIDRKIMDLKSR